ncbi:molybdopterin-guanine dinucleotide biosynthesis protein B [Paenibacillus sp. 32352]|uniref:molybdopterin-guanine dinucleotide biosynthesis protein B n=1 Tax=Paenibacillus sp. 32352 TaxID=1969111 RepID=UPI0009ADDBAF|nr:molybdopterin-guanine dinucleotide biosynthesis protein B [Paenibacillus sp. 32352]
MIPFIGFAGFSDSGKTTLISRLVKHYQNQGIRVGVIKHDAHGHYKEAAGSDSSQYIHAGASAAIVVSPESYIVYRREPHTLEQMVEKLQSEALDLILVEGFKQGKHDQIALFRSEEQANIINQLPREPVAVVAPMELTGCCPDFVPHFAPDDIASIAEFILLHIKFNACEDGC